MPDKIIAASLTLNPEQANTSVKSFKQQLKEANEDLLNIQENFGPTSAEALKAAKAVAQLKDQMQEAKEVTALFDPGAKFQVFGNVLRTVSGGVTALTGTMALLGGESADLEKTLIKVQAALAITEGVNTIVDAGKDFTRLKAVAVDAFKSIKVAIGETGIGLIVLAVGAIAANWEKIKATVSGVTSEQKRLNEESKANYETAVSHLDALSSQDNILKLQGKSEREILQYKIRATDEAIRLGEIEIANAVSTAAIQIKTAARNKEILAGAISFVQTPLILILKGVDAIGNAFGKKFGLSDGFLNLINKGAGLLFDPEKTQKESAETIKVQSDALNKLKNDRAGFQLAIQGIDKEAADKSAANAKAANDAAIAEEKRLHDRIKELRQGDVVDYIDYLAELDEKKKAADKELQDKIDKQKEGLSGKGPSAAAGISPELEAQRQLFYELNAERRSQFEIQLADLEEYYKKRLKIAGTDEKLIKQVTEDYQKQTTAIVKQQLNLRLSITAGLLGSISEIVGKQTAVGKGFAVAQATINTFLAGTEALKAIKTAKTPFEALIGIVTMGSVIAAGLKSVKEIVKVQVPGGGGSISSISTDAPAPLSPALPVVQTNSLIDQASINQLGNATTRAYVVEADVTDSQEKISRLNRAARLGG